MPFLAVGPLHVGPSVMGQEQFPLLVKNGSVSRKKSHPTEAWEDIAYDSGLQTFNFRVWAKAMPLKRSSSAVPKSLFSPPDKTSCWSEKLIPAYVYV